MGRGTALCVLGIGAGAAAVAIALAVAGDRPPPVAAEPVATPAPPLADPIADERARYLEWLAGDDLERRLIAIGRLLEPRLWDPDVVMPAFVTVLRHEGPAAQTSEPAAQLVRRIIDGLRDHPSLTHVPALFECMDDSEGSWLNMQIHGVLFGWLAGSDRASEVLNVRGTRRSWRQLWDKHGDARLRPRGRDWPTGEPGRR